jgi:hypothetical protein
MPHQVHSATHPGMRGPLNLLMGENWLVWHFWNPSQLSYQMAVIELFTNVTFAVRLSPLISAQSRLQSRPNLACNLASQDDPLSLMIGGGPDYSKRENGFDGFRHAPPHVLSQSYSFAAPVEALAVTQTVQGITPKYVLTDELR